MRFLYSLFVLTFLLLPTAGCETKPDYEKIKTEILEQHQAQLDAHKTKDISFFTKDLADDYFSVGRGEIRHPTKEEIEAQFTRYLGHTEFTKYENVEEPIIGYSDDGSVAWSIVRVNVAGIYTHDDGTPEEFDDIWAWITLFKRDGDKWLRMGEVSNVMENKS